jgi:hypothetical protein
MGLAMQRGYPIHHAAEVMVNRGEDVVECMANVVSIQRPLVVGTAFGAGFGAFTTGLICGVKVAGQVGCGRKLSCFYFTKLGGMDMTTFFLG